MKLLSFVLMSIGLSACSIAPMVGSDTPVYTSLADGVYSGRYGNFPNLARVKVTIKDGRIDHIRLVHHGMPKARKTAQRIIDKQSTIVDAVSGATNSSIVIMNAVQCAIDNGSQVD